MKFKQREEYPYYVCVLQLHYYRYMHEPLETAGTHLTQHLETESETQHSEPVCLLPIRLIIEPTINIIKLFQ